MNTTALKTVRELLVGDRDAFQKCDSASLRLEKFVRLGDNTKKAEIDAVVGMTQQKIPQVLPKGAVSFVVTLGGRLIVNQAGGVLENAGLCLHPHFNAPYIPGSAVKGCARHAAWREWNAMEEGADRDKLAEEIAEIFGCPTNDKEGLDKNLERLYRSRIGDPKAKRPANSGCVCFMPAYPDGKATLVADILTPHGGANGPVPNAFPAVEKGSSFRFSILCPSTLRMRVIHYLVAGIAENGIGAKTAGGYGWFVCNEADVLKQIDENQKERERADRVKKIADNKRDREGLLRKKYGEIASRYPGEDILDSAHGKSLENELSELECELESFVTEFSSTTLRDELQSNINRLKKRIPQASPFDLALREWSGQQVAERVKHRYILDFAKDDVTPASIKRRLVALLRSQDGIGLEMWQFLRNDANFNCLKKKTADRLRAAVQAIRVFAKTTPEGKLR